MTIWELAGKKADCIELNVEEGGGVVCIGV